MCEASRRNTTREQIVIRLMVESAAYRYDANCVGDLITTLKNPFILLGETAITWREALHNSYVHSVRKVDDGLTKLVGRIMVLDQPSHPIGTMLPALSKVSEFCGMVSIIAMLSCIALGLSMAQGAGLGLAMQLYVEARCIIATMHDTCTPGPGCTQSPCNSGPQVTQHTVMMMVCLLCLFLRSRSFAEHVLDFYQVHGFEGGLDPLIKCMIDYNAESPLCKRFIIPAVLHNGRNQRLQTDLQGYTLDDVVAL